MKRLLGASLTIALAVFSTSAFAAELPEVKTSAGNKVPQCATPGRLTAYLQSRNPNLDPRFEGVATQYMRHGEALGLRWDIAFFQMILETGALRFGGDVRPAQNNFAGLGASGGGARGESFGDVSSGVKAHLQHLMMYAGEHIDNPVAERTRKVQEWGVLTDWQKSIDGPMTFTLVAKQWAPTSRNYVRDVSTISDEFYNGFCDREDPNPGLVQEALQGREPKSMATAKAKAKSKEKATEVAAVAEPAAEAQAPEQAAPKGAEIAKQRIEEERKEGAPLKALGAGMIGSITKTAAAEPSAPAGDSPPVVLLNAKPEAEKVVAEPAPESKSPAPKADNKAKAKTEAKILAKVDPKGEAKGAEVQTASIGSAATQLKIPPAKSGKCRVWTASYGGQRAVIIKAAGSGTVNYTVLDVTESNEKREVDAYIAAYAKGGEKVASFPTQTKALNKAFELCPEG
ncbi:MAG: glucosaminidase domain-containing protein [Hyphomicrobium sp.]|nr:glucosaminidase domain-containing protein [Hyphomicrobium sp.]